jgi:hydroxyethylthiazole kinase-like uncharacterized protein yjeF
MSAGDRVDAAAVRSVWPVPTAEDDKYSRGVLGIVAGSEAYPGAAVLACTGALRAGVGAVHYVGPRRAQDLVLHHRPEVIVHEPADASHTLPRASAWLVGPGVADHPGQDAVIGAVLASGLPVVVDAGALEAAARSRAAGARPAAADQVLFTPHADELTRTLNAIRHDVSPQDVRDDRLAHARLLAEAARATVLLKGAITLVASPGGAVRELPSAPAWLATAGSGDVLAGIAGALLAAGLSAADAGASAAWVHARAGEMASGGGPLLAMDLADLTPAVVTALLDRD